MEATMAPTRRRTREREDGPAHVLVVEDNDDMRVAISEVLRMRGLGVTMIAGGLHVREEALRRRYDAAICDIRMPGKNGVEVARELRRLESPPQVILITAYPDWKVYQEASEAGAFCLLRKPIDLVLLADLVARAIERGRGSRG